jgi:sugar transferase (PEP-CTERM system associated)
MGPLATRLMALEGAALLAAVWVTALVWGQAHILDWRDIASVGAQALGIVLCCMVALYYNDLYDRRVVRTFGDFASRLVQALGVAFILLAVLYTALPELSLARAPLASAFLIVVGLLLPLRAASYTIMRSRPFRERLLILGASDLAARLIHEIELQPHLRFDVAGVVDDGPGSSSVFARHALLGPLARVDKIVEELRPDRIVVALSERRGRLPVQQLLEARVRGIRVEEGLALYERLTGKLAVETLVPSFLIFSRGFTKSRVQLGLRRLISLAAATAGLVVTAPLMALIALAIRLESPGPALFVQERAGLDGQPFRLLKFRTMRERERGEDRSVWRRDDDARVTRIGRLLRFLRLDELPQFWNVLKGDMNLVGPRPEIARNVRTMEEEIPYYALRHVVRPGVTGWAQVRVGYSVSRDEVIEKLRHDLYYIAHMSFRMDARILLDTVKIVLFGRGAR